MNWDAIGAVGEILGAGAVVATLAYLAIQVRQTNRSAKTSSQQAVFTNFLGLTADLINDNDTIAIIRKGFASWTELTPDEQATIHNYWATLFGHLSMAYTLFREGVLDHETYIGFENNAVSALREPGLADWWKLASRNFNPPLVERLKQRLADAETLPPTFTEIFPYYRL
jgi:hypothetical protein